MTAHPRFIVIIYMGVVGSLGLKKNLYDLKNVDLMGTENDEKRW